MKAKSLLLSLFAFSFFFLLLFFRGRFEGYEKETFFAAEALLVGGTPGARIGALGVLLSMPFALLYKGANRLGWDTVRDLMGPLSVVFYTALMPVVFYWINEKLFTNRRIALFQALILLIGTMVFPYAFIGMEHTTALLLLISYGFLVTYHKKEDPRSIILSAVALSGAILVKPYSILFVIPIVLYLLISRRMPINPKIPPPYKNEHSSQTPSPLPLRRGKKTKAIIITTIVLVAGIAAHLLWNYATFANFLSGRYRLAWEFQYDSLIAGIYGFLFSPGKSIFIFNPVLLLAIPGWVTFFKKERALATATLVGIFIFMIFHAPFRFWTDEIWGPRKLLAVIPLALIPAGYVWGEFAKRCAWIKITTCGIILASVCVQILGVLYRTGKYLFFLRDMKLDALPFMQYVPTLSQINVHWFFLKAYLYHLIGVSVPVFTYTIDTWMRALFPAGRDILLLGGSATPKEIFYTPDLWYLSRQIPYSWVSAEYKIAYVAVVVIGLIISGRMLYERAR